LKAKVAFGSGGIGGLKRPVSISNFIRSIRSYPPDPKANLNLADQPINLAARIKDPDRADFSGPAFAIGCR
jgi:hypothetical protein